MSWLSPRIKRELHKIRTNTVELNEMVARYEQLTNEQNGLIEELNKNNQLHVEVAGQHEALIQNQKETILQMKAIIEIQGEKLKEAGIETNAAPDNQPNTPE